VSGDFSGDPATSDEISYRVQLNGDATPDQLHTLVQKVDQIAEIPNSLRRATSVKLADLQILVDRTPGAS
jgi:putative redox protein